jgi:hypothetical protein
MLLLLNHAGPLEGNFETNYDLNVRQGINLNNDNNTINNNVNNKDCVSLKKCISTNNNNKNNTMFINNNGNPSLPPPEELDDITYEKEQNNSLLKEKQELEEFYKNILLKLNEDDRRREEEMRLHILNMNSHLKYLDLKKQKLENLNYTLNKLYMDLKYDFDLTEKKLIKEIENSKNKNALLQKGIKDSKKKAKIEKEMDHKEYNKRSKQLSSTLRNQIKTNTETGIIALKQLNEISKMYEQKINLIKNKYDMAEEKYKLLQQHLYQIGNPENPNNIPVLKDEFEKVINIFRERMKQHENYINEIKQMVEGDYDHYELIKEITQNKNRNFFDDINDTENNLLQFLEEVLKAKNEYEKLIPYINEIARSNSNNNMNVLNNGNGNNMSDNIGVE